MSAFQASPGVPGATQRRGSAAYIGVLIGVFIASIIGSIIGSGPQVSRAGMPATFQGGSS